VLLPTSVGPSVASPYSQFRKLTISPRSARISHVLRVNTCLTLSTPTPVGLPVLGHSALAGVMSPEVGFVKRVNSSKLFEQFKIIVAHNGDTLSLGNTKGELLLFHGVRPIEWRQLRSLGLPPTTLPGPSSIPSGRAFPRPVLRCSRNENHGGSHTTGLVRGRAENATPMVFDNGPAYRWCVGAPFFRVVDQAPTIAILIVMSNRRSHRFPVKQFCY